ncbi:MAG: hypothetical protein GY758_26435 [Fuerstiella sp.]|nr:hypothetical protein [Fuerstiella sp.]MCP4506838.1 hypothetical protein [Fuerstiella sp.]
MTSLNRCKKIWRWTSFSQTDRNQRRRIRTATQIRVEQLECRCLLAASTFTPEEQLMLELVNRARADPAAESASQGIDLNQGLAPGTISTDAKQPLAPNNQLDTAADGHTADMFVRGFFAHTSPAPGSTTASQRVTNAGYPWTRTGENLAIQTYFSLNRSLVTSQMHNALFGSSGHRVNFMNSLYFEVGVGVDFGSFTDTNNVLGGGVNAVHSAGIATQNFGTQTSQPFVTGVVFTDASDASGSDDSFYTVGEQAGGGGTVTVTNADSGAVVTETIGTAGGYSVQVPAGTYNITVSGGGLATTYIVTGVVVGTENVKVDFETTTAVVAPTTQYDFGDAPDPGYPTLTASDGARHVIGGGTFLGASVDAESDGQPNAAATGDTDNGVTMTSGFVQGTLAAFDVTASGSGFLNVWFDANANSSFDDGGDLVLSNQALVAGSNSLSFSVPASATPGTTYLRFRFTSQAVASPSPRGTLPDGEVEDFAVNTQLPAPTITTAHNTVTNNGQFQLNWTDVTGAEGYEVSYTNTATGQASFVQETVTTNSFTPSSPLPIARYNIWVRVKQSNGATSPWSTPISVHVNTPVTVNSMTFHQTTVRPTISWTAVNGAVRYEVWGNNITADLAQAVHDTNVTSTSFTPSADLNFGLYRVWVRGYDARGVTTQWSGSQDFYLGPQLIAPLSPQFETTPQFSWTPITGASTYQLYLQRGSTVVINQSGIATTSFTASSALPVGEYRWWIRPSTATGKGGAWSQRGEFNVGGWPTVLTPEGTTTSGAPTITWTAVTGAGSYEVYLFNDDGLGLVYRTSGITSNSFDPPALANGNYRVWVKSYKTNSDPGSWSRAQSFMVDAATVSLPTSVVSPVTPTFDTTPTFQWAATPTAILYDIHLHNGSTAISQNNIVGTSWTPTAPLSAGPWQWWVRAINGTGAAGEWSTVATTDPSGRSVLLGPVGTIADTTPAITWTAVEGASRYVLQVDNLTTATSQVIREDNLTTNSFDVVAALSSGNYRFWVRAINAANNAPGPWSIPIDFSVADAALDTSGIDVVLTSLEIQTIDRPRATRDKHTSDGPVGLQPQLQADRRPAPTTSDSSGLFDPNPMYRQHSAYRQTKPPGSTVTDNRAVWYDNPHEDSFVNAVDQQFSRMVESGLWTDLD